MHSTRILKSASDVAQKLKHPPSQLAMSYSRPTVYKTTGIPNHVFFSHKINLGLVLRVVHMLSP